MATVYDVAAYILERLGPITAMKLQKLVYYSQAWALVWDESPLFQQRIEAWAHGPVAPDLYDLHKGEFKVAKLPMGKPDDLTTVQRETIDKVLEFYGDKSSQWLSDLTHKENPWIEARHGYAPGQPGNEEITHAAMMEYYSSL